MFASFKKYYKYVVGDCYMPSSFVENILFTAAMAILMGISMVSVVETITHMPADIFLFVVTHVLPCMIIIGGSIRLFLLDKPIQYCIRKFVLPKFGKNKLLLSVMITSINVLAMATIMCALGTAIGCIISAGDLSGLSTFVQSYSSILPFIYLFAFVFSLLVVGPIAKIFINQIHHLQIRKQTMSE